MPSYRNCCASASRHGNVEEGGVVGRSVRILNLGQNGN